MIKKGHIDGGRGFDFGKTSRDYARYRDIYPQEFYECLLRHGIGAKGQHVLDIGTGTGVLPRNMYRYGAHFVGADIAAHQIEQAKELAAKEKMDIPFFCAPAEQLDFPDGSFDAVTACQCFTYFDHAALAPKLYRLLQKDGRLAAMYMAWLPYEDAIAGASEELVLQFHPGWTGCGETRRPIEIPPDYAPYFEISSEEIFDLRVPFTRETWNGRMRSCRGIGASLSDEEVARFDREHRALLEHIAPETFDVLHYAAVTVLRRK